MGKLKGRKTYIVGALGVLGAIVGFLVGDMSAPQAAQLAITSLLGMTLRNGMA